LGDSEARDYARLRAQFVPSNYKPRFIRVSFEPLADVDTWD
jgi:hypothetical protein